MTRRSLDLLILLLLILLLSRHVWLAAYIHPYADDFSYAFKGMRSELLDRLALEYRHWNGRYFSNILVLRGPLTAGWDKGLVLYRWMPVLLMILVVHASYVLLRTAKIPSGPKLHCLLAALGFLAALLHLMPHAGEGLYWYTGAVTYFLPGIFMLYSGVAVLRCSRAKSAMASGAWGALMVLLIIAVAGSNEVAAAYMVVACAVALCVVFRTSGRMRSLFAVAFFVSLACALVVCFAPGNAVRGNYFEHAEEPLRTLVYATAQTARFAGYWVLSPVFVLVAIVILAWAQKQPVDHPLTSWASRVDRRSVLLWPLLAVFIAMALPYWGTGVLGQHRTANAALFVFLPLAWLALLVWDVQVFRGRGWHIPLSSRGQRPLLLGLLAVFLLLARHDGDVTSDLFTGRAARYDAQCMGRYVRVQDAIGAGAGELELEALSGSPKSLSVLDLSPAPGHWMNTSLALYFGSDSLRIRAVTD